MSSPPLTLSDNACAKSKFFVLAIISGVLWWLLSLLMGAKGMGILGSHWIVGLAAGVITGTAVTAISVPVYKRLSPKHLYWYSPLSVYVAVAVYVMAVSICRLVVGDFRPNEIPWAAGLQTILGMLWGITFSSLHLVVLQGLAYLNHRALRKILSAA